MDRASIERMIYDYADAVDEGDFGTIASLFASGCLILHEPGDTEPIVLDGAGAIVTFFTDVAKIASGPARTRHLVSNIRTDIDTEAGSAHATATFVVFHLQADQGSPLATIGRYQWDFETSGATWAIRRLDIFAEYRSA